MLSSHWLVFLKEKTSDNGESSNGRTSDFGSGYLGSNPSSPDIFSDSQKRGCMIPFEDEVRAFFSQKKADLVGHSSYVCKDGSIYNFYRGKIQGKTGENSAPRALIVVEVSGSRRPIQEINSYGRKKLRVALEKHSQKKSRRGRNRNRNRNEPSRQNQEPDQSGTGAEGLDLGGAQGERKPVQVSEKDGTGRRRCRSSIGSSTCDADRSPRTPDGATGPDL